MHSSLNFNGSENVLVAARLLAAKTTEVLRISFRTGSKSLSENRFLIFPWISRSFDTVVEFGRVGWRESAERQVDVADLNHGCAGGQAGGNRPP